jgi:hypothetical protein
MNAVVRYTLVDLARRRGLLGLIGIELVLLAALGLARRPGGEPILVETFALFLALIIGACAFRPELESGAMALLWTRPLRRSAYANGKLVAAGLVLLGAVLLPAALSLPASRILGAQPRLLAGAFALAWANAAPVLVAVMVLSTRLNGPVAALLGFVLFEAAGAVTALRAVFPGAAVQLAYHVLPHRLSLGWLGLADLAGWAVYLVLLAWLLQVRLERLSP